MGLRHLKFFDKKGNAVTPLISDDGVFKFSLMFDRVSTGLFSVEHVFIFEEILREFNREELTNKQRVRVNPYVSTEIKILKHINSAGVAIAESELTTYFQLLTLGVNAVGDFINIHLDLFDRTFTNGEFVISMTTYGDTFLRAYEEKEDEFLYNAESVKTDFVRPRANYIEEEGEDYYLYYKWQDSTYDKNIFSFLVDTTDKTSYYRGEKAVCDDDAVMYPSIIPMYDDSISPDINEEWRNFFQPSYKWDNGNFDNFEIPDVEERVILNETTGEYEVKTVPLIPYNQMRRKIDSTKTLNQVPLQLNLALYSETEGEITRTLDVYLIKRSLVDGGLVENSVKLAEVTCVGEVVGKDERLEKILRNFGRGIDDLESYIFRDVDVDEDNPDFIKINEKNKELLLSGEEIYPFLGSYKGFFNALKWLGYFDLDVREYFYNVRLSDPANNKAYYATVDLPTNLTIPVEIKGKKSYDSVIYKQLLSNPDFRQTARYDLVYQINKWTGGFDEQGYPIMEDNFQYTAEEALIKLYGLKNILQKYFMPHHARIINISGEGVYFAKYHINYWNNQNKTIALKYGQSPKFEAVPLKGYLKRLDQILTLYRQTFNLADDEIFTEIDTLEDLQFRTLEEVSEKWLQPAGTRPATPVGGYTEKVQLGYGHACCGADPRGPNFYINLSTGDLYEKPEVYNSTLATTVECEKYTVVKCTWQYIKNLRTGEYNVQGQILNFDTDVTFDKILSFYPSYQDLRTAILDHLFNSYCDYSTGTESAKVLSNTLYTNSKKKLLGMPVLIRIIPNEVTWNDLDIPWDYLEFQTPALIEDGANRLFTWDGIGNYDGYHIRWNVNHEDDGYCFQDDGFIKDHKEILCFLPDIGFYDVSCRITDITNFPHLSKKSKYIEVEPNQPDFIAFGRWYDTKSTWEDYDGTTWDEVEGSWNDGNYCPEVTTWDDAELAWDDLDYGNYLSQRFTEPFETSAEITVIDEVNNQITVQGTDLYNDYIDYKAQWWREVLVLENTNTAPLYEDLNVTAVSAGKVLVDGTLDIKIGELINVYKKEIVAPEDFTILNNTITLTTEFAAAFDIGNFINLIRVVDDERIKESYEILDYTINYIDGMILVTVDDDGSLNYTTGTNALGNISRFSEIELTGDSYLLRITGYDHTGGQTIVSVDDPSKFCGELKKKVLTDYYASYAVSSGRFTWEIANIELDSTYQNSLVTFENWEALCYITTNFQAKWAEFDYDWAQRFGTSRQNFWDNYDNISWDDARHQTWDSLDFAGPTTMSFHITSVADGGKVIMNDETLTFDFSKVSPHYKVFEAVRQLTNAVGLFSRFEYNVIKGRWIIATNKVEAVSALVSLKGVGGVEINSDTFPRLNFANWEDEFFPGYNNPALWNHLKREWVENGSNFENWDNDEMEVDPYTSMRGAFTVQDAFIKSKDFAVPLFTPVFIIFNGYEDLDGNAEFEWELWEDTRGKLMGKSEYPYLIWNFVDTGAYTVKLTIKTNNSSYSFMKRSWIRATNEL